MSIRLIVGLIILSGLLAVPSYYLTELAKKRVRSKNGIIRAGWFMIMVVSGTYSMLAVLVWSAPALLGLMAGASLGLVGEQLNTLLREHPQVIVLIGPLLPFIGPPMLIIALISRPFYKPAVLTDTGAIAAS